MDQKISALYDDYRQGRTNRRQFIRRLALVAGSSSAALALLPVLDLNSALLTNSDQTDP
jgi:carboxymethylenebutenolidase